MRTFHSGTIVETFTCMKVVYPCVGSALADRQGRTDTHTHTHRTEMPTDKYKTHIQVETTNIKMQVTNTSDPRLASSPSISVSEYLGNEKITSTMFCTLMGNEQSCYSMNNILFTLAASLHLAAHPEACTDDCD